MKARVAILTTARSDYGLLSGVIGLAKEVFKVDVLITGSHHLQSLNLTRQEVESDWSEDGKVELINFDGMDVDQSATGQLATLSKTMLLLQDHLSKTEYDAVIFLGDRWELWSATIPFFLTGTVLAHISGGETTEGAIDDSIRHSHTMMSHLHFVANQEYARNVSLMGVEDWRITVSGECGLDAIFSTPMVSEDVLTQQFGVRFERPIVMVTFHASMLASSMPISLQVSNLLVAVSKFPDYLFVFTSPAMEQGYEVIQQGIADYIACHKNALYVPSFGRDNYISMMKKSFIVLGNSSSGIVEAPSLGIPSINVGDRQKTRMAGESVLHIPCESSQIESALRLCSSDYHRSFCRGSINPYDPHKDGRNCERIVSTLECALNLRDKNSLLKKSFSNKVDEEEWNFFWRKLNE